MSACDSHVQGPHLNTLGGLDTHRDPVLEDGGEGYTLVQMEQDRTVSREVERGRVRGAGPVSSYLGQAANRLVPQTSPHQPHPQHISTAEPSGGHNAKNSGEARNPALLPPDAPGPGGECCLCVGL